MPEWEVRATRPLADDPSRWATFSHRWCCATGLKLIQLCRLAGVSSIWGIEPLGFRAEAALAAGAVRPEVRQRGRARGHPHIRKPAPILPYPLFFILTGHRTAALTTLRSFLRAHARNATCQDTV